MTPAKINHDNPAYGGITTIKPTKDRWRHQRMGGDVIALNEPERRDSAVDSSGRVAGQIWACRLGVP